MKWISILTFLLVGIIPSNDTFAQDQSFNIQHISTNDGLPDRWVTRIAKDSLGFMWFGTRKGLAKWDGQTFSNYDNLMSNPQQLSFNEISKLVIEKNRLWVAGERDTNLIDLQTNQVFHEEIGLMPAEKKHPFSGVFNDALPDIKKQVQSQFGFKWPVVKSTFIDPNGSIWIGTMNGIFIATPKSPYFEKIISEDNSELFEGNQVRGMAEIIKGQFYISTNNGGFINSPGENSFTQKKELQSDDKSRFNLNHIFDVALGSSPNELWMTGRGRILLSDIKNQTYKLISENNFKGYKTILQDDDRLLIGFSNGVSIFNKKTKKLIRRLTHPELAKARVLFVSSERRVFIGSENGLFIFDTEGDFLTHLHTNSQPALNNNFVYDAIEAKNGRVWVGTKGGIQSLNLTSGQSKIYTSASGLSNNIVANILEDDSSDLWLATFNGLSRFDPVDERFENYFIEDGISHNEFNYGSKLRTEDGLFLFGTLNGVTSFDPNKIPRKKSNAPLRLIKFSTYDKKDGNLIAQTNNLDQLKDITISPRNKYFRFEYALLNFNNQQKIQYSYYLDGYDDDWQAATNANVAQYNNIPAGKYIFKVRASPGIGRWSDSQIEVGVDIKQAFHKTIWFYLLILSIITGLFYLIYRYRLMQAIRLERLRTKIASDLHDEVGSIMTRISISSELLKTGAMDEEEQSEELDQISAQSRVATSTMSDVIWSIDARADQVKHMIDRMREHVEELLYPKGIMCQFELSGLDEEKKLNVSVRQNIYFIFREAINNIAKHSNASEVNIFIKNGPKHFNMSIKDNGTSVGNSIKKGQGLSNMKMRAERLNGDIEINQEEGFNIELNMGRL